MSYRRAWVLYPLRWHHFSVVIDTTGVEKKVREKFAINPFSLILLFLVNLNQNARL